MKHTILTDDQYADIICCADIKSETELGLMKVYDIALKTDSLKGNFTLVNSCESNKHVLVQKVVT